MLQSQSEKQREDVVPHFQRQSASINALSSIKLELHVDKSFYGTLCPHLQKPMTDEKSKDPLQGVTLERMVTELHVQYGWEGLAEKIHIRCFQENPSVTSSLKFLRRTPWARTKVERLYIKLVKKHGAKLNRKKEE